MAYWSCIVGWSVLAVVCISSVSAKIFPDEDFGYRHYAKKDISTDCMRCMRSYDYQSCLRCWSTKYAVIPFYSKRSSDESVSEDTGSDVMSRERRFTGCNCCFSSRFSNSYCCDVCNTASKRMGKRSEEVLEAPEKKMMPSCMCCSYGNVKCCEECFSGYMYN